MVVISLPRRQGIIVSRPNALKRRGREALARAGCKEVVGTIVGPFQKRIGQVYDRFLPICVPPTDVLALKRVVAYLCRAQKLSLCVFDIIGRIKTACHGIIKLTISVALLCQNDYSEACVCKRLLLIIGKLPVRDNFGRRITQAFCDAVFELSLFSFFREVFRQAQTERVISINTRNADKFGSAHKKFHTSDLAILYQHGCDRVAK